MALARFFDRAYFAAGRKLSISRESLERALAGTVVGLECGPDVQGADNARWIARLAANLVARFYPSVSLVAPAPLDQELRELMCRINPAIHFDSTPSADDLVIRIGSPMPGGLHPRADGWVAILAAEPGGYGGASNPYSAAFAGALAVAELFRRVFRDRLGPAVDWRDVTVSLLDFSRDSGRGAALPAVDLGEVAFVGLGAVGQAALWVLREHRDLTGILRLIDNEHLDLSNLQRYLLAVDAEVGKHKTTLAEKALAGTRLVTTRHRMRLEQYAQSLADWRIPTMCVSVDNVPGRRIAQSLLPRLVINAWTGDGSLGASWHRFAGDRACLACLYHPDGAQLSQTELVAEALGLPKQRAAALWVTDGSPTDDELTQIASTVGVGSDFATKWKGLPLRALYTEVACGQVTMDVRGLGRIDAVPLAHQSALAGILLAVELVKRTDLGLSEESQPETLVVWDDVLKPPPQRWLQRRPKHAGCFCCDPIYQHVYREKWADTAAYGP